jgi:hypothetical protein
MDYEVSNRILKAGVSIDQNIDLEGVHENAALFWQQDLTNAHRLELPVDFPRTSSTSDRLNRLTFSLAPACFDLLKQLNRQLETPSVTTLLAACSTLLFRYTG